MTSPKTVLATRWKKCYIRPLPPYFIVLVSLVKPLEIKAVEFHRMIQIDYVSVEMFPFSWFPLSNLIKILPHTLS